MSPFAKLTGQVGILLVALSVIIVIIQSYQRRIQEEEESPKWLYPIRILGVVGIILVGISLWLSQSM